MNSQEISKYNAAKKLCDKLRGELEKKSFIGIGSGSTVKVFLDVCSEFLRNHILVASSIDTALYAKLKHNLLTVDITSVDALDLYVDGADEVSTRLDMVKGHGGALLREKTLAYMSNWRIYIVDYSKYTGLEYLYRKPIPVEVVPFALGYFLKNISKLGVYEPTVRTSGGKLGPLVTDNGNYIVDLKPLQPITNPLKAHQELKFMHGVVETGLFPSDLLVDVVIVGYEDRVIELEKKVVSNSAR